MVPPRQQPQRQQLQLPHRRQQPPRQVNLMAADLHRVRAGGNVNGMGRWDMAEAREVVPRPRPNQQRHPNNNNDEVVVNLMAEDLRR